MAHVKDVLSECVIRLMKVLRRVTAGLTLLLRPFRTLHFFADSAHCAAHKLYGEHEIGEVPAAVAHSAVALFSVNASVPQAIRKYKEPGHLATTTSNHRTSARPPSLAPDVSPQITPTDIRKDGDVLLHILARASY